MKYHTLYALAGTLALCGVCHAQKTTVDPNTARPAGQAECDLTADARLARKLSCEAWHTPLKTILADISKSTGVTLNAGYNKQDWQVRDRRMNVYVKDITLAELMNSIARVMKFKWSRNDELNPPTYRLYADRRLLAKLQAEASNRQNELKREEIRRRTKLMDALAKAAKASSAQLEELRQSNPYLYLCAETGFAKMMTQVFADEPRVRDAFLNGSKNVKLTTDHFQPATALSCGETIRRSNELDRITRGYHGLPDNFDEVLPRVEIHFSLITCPDEESVRRRLAYFGNIGSWCDGDYSVGSLRDPDSRSARVWAEKYLTAREQRMTKDEFDNQSWSDVYVAEQKDAEATEYYLMLDPVEEHPDEAGMHDKIKPRLGDEERKALEEQVETLGDEAYPRLAYQAALKALADAGRLNVVSDSYNVILGDEPSFPDEVELQVAITKLCDAYKLNWEQHNSVLELRRRDWFRRRASQIPDEWIKPWRDELEKSGLFSLNTYCHVALLDDQQTEENIYSDHLLNQGIAVAWEFDNNRGFSRFYVQLSDAQRSAVFADQGLDVHTLSPAQWQYYTEMFDYGRRYTYGLDAGEFVDPGTNDAVLRGFYEPTKSGTVLCKPRVVLTKADGSKKENGWWITLSKVKRP